MKKILSFFLAVIMIFPLQAIAFSAETNGIVTQDTAFLIKKNGYVNTQFSRSGSTSDENTFSFKIAGKENYDYANSVLTKLNRIRTNAGLPKLIMDIELIEIAMQRAAECAIYFTHTRPDNTDCFTLASSDISSLGENIAMGQETPEEVITDWKNSAAHYQNMTSDLFNCVGIGCFETTNGTLVWVQYFGHKEPEISEKTGSIKAKRSITALETNLDLKISASNNVSNGASTNDVFDFIVENYNVVFPSCIQKISSSYFSFSSNNPKVISIKDEEKGIVEGKGTSKITATVQKNSDIQVTNEICINHIHSGSLESTSEKATGCERIITKNYICNQCHRIFTKKNTIYHFPGNWITDKKATVYKAGSKHKECTKCGEVLKKASIPQLKCTTPTLTECSNTASGVKISWKTVKGADTYRIYRKTSKGDWEYLDSTSNTYFTDKTAKSGTKYYYAVRAKNEAGLSSRSSALSKYYLEDPVLSTPSSTTKGIGLKWTKVIGAEGYLIYRKTGSSGSYTRIATEKGVSNLAYRDKSAKKGKKYTYKVKAYCSKTLSVSSNEKTITDKY